MADIVTAFWGQRRPPPCLPPTIRWVSFTPSPSSISIGFRRATGNARLAQLRLRQLIQSVRLLPATQRAMQKIAGLTSMFSSSWGFFRFLYKRRNKYLNKLFTVFEQFVHQCLNTPPTFPYR